jgi:hypothetical protein
MKNQRLIKHTIALAFVVGCLVPTRLLASATTITQSASDFASGQFKNTVLVINGLTLGTDTTPTTFQSEYKYYGLFTSSEQSVNAFDSIKASYNASIPNGSVVVLSVRTLSFSGHWSPWQEISEADLGKSIDVVGNGWQYRLTLYAKDLAQAPIVHSVKIQTSASGKAQAGVAIDASCTSHPTYTVYATREGLVGQRTANGHLIVSRDHFVALPSNTVLDCDGCSTYTVTVRYPVNGRSVTERVYDVGPWNTHDNYWHSPRAEFTDLDIGLPEAQAAYQTGYNGGHDEFGRSVSNPAGIDLADGTFWDSLGMSGNDWVEVTYNWESCPPTSFVVDNSGAGFSASANWATGTSSTDKHGTDYRYHSTVSSSDPATWVVSLPNSASTSVYAWWPQGGNRSTSAPYIVYHNGTSTSVNVNQQINGGKWNLLGTWSMTAGNNTVKLSCWTTTGFVVMADAIKWTQ